MKETRLQQLLEVRVDAGNLVLGLLTLLLAYEYFSARYFARFPDYRLSYLIAGVATVYYVALRFVRYKRSNPVAMAVMGSLLDLLAAVGVVGLVVQLGVYPVSFLLDRPVAIYQLPAALPAYVVTAVFAGFMVPRVVAHFFLLPIPLAPVVAPVELERASTLELQGNNNGRTMRPTETVGLVEQVQDHFRAVGTIEGVLQSLEEKATELTRSARSGSQLDINDVELMLRLSDVTTEVRKLWANLEARGISYNEIGSKENMEFLRRGHRRPRPAEWEGLSLLKPEPTTRQVEGLPSAATDNPWIDVLRRRGAAKKSASQE